MLSSGQLISICIAVIYENWKMDRLDNFDKIGEYISEETMRTHSRNEVIDYINSFLMLEKSIIDVLGQDSALSATFKNMMSDNEYGKICYWCDK